ncbi:MAG: metallophosphoesterase [Clostridia bacterium]|nr:metallophosphoesterase [Clostridia bacterium]
MISKKLEGFKIAQISDLHNTQIGEDNCKIIEKLKEISPDIIAITGDLIDSRNTSIEIALSLVKQAQEIAPCYYVTGNHEDRVEDYPILEQGLKALGVTVLRSESTIIDYNGEKINLIGIDDPMFDLPYGDSNEGARMMIYEDLKGLIDNNYYNLVLSHRPEAFEEYTQLKANLVLCGHAHGGQIRLPFLGGVLAPNQGFFPKYEEGRFDSGNTTMIVSRGIGNSLFPFRVNNTPEIVVVTLSPEG